MGLTPPPPPRPRNWRPPAVVDPPVNPRSAFLELLLAVLLIGLALLLPGCATLSNSQPVKVVCASCALLSSSGLCAASSGLRAMALPTCPEGQELWLVNYSAVVKNGAEPKLECR